MKVVLTSATILALTVLVMIGKPAVGQQAAAGPTGSSSPASKPANSVEIIVSEYSPVGYTVARGGPLTFIRSGTTKTYFEATYGVADQGEYPERVGVGSIKFGQWGVGGRLVTHLCGYIYKDTKPVVDVTPDEPKPGDPLVCKVVVKSDIMGEKLIDDYSYAWKRFEGTDKEFRDGKGKWVDADVPKTAELAKGITKDGERWACFVQPILPGGGKPIFEVADKVEIGAAVPGDSRVNSPFGSFYGQYRHTRAYFKFDLSSLAGKPVKAVKFRMFCDVQNPPFVVNAYACASDWDERHITWVNQPLKFPFADKPVGSVKMDYGPLPTAENPASTADWSFSSSPDLKKEGQNRAPDWREIDITDYARKSLASGAKSLSVCLACEPQTVNDHSRAHIHNEKPAPGYKIDRGDMRPRLAIEMGEPGGK